ncbi:MAG: AMP-binding protein, partial [Acidobacteriota bacterium]
MKSGLSSSETIVDSSSSPATAAACGYGAQASSLITEQFAAQVAATPDAVAAELDGELLTYRVLDRRARKLARRLRAEGVQPETRVAICMERSLDSV